MNPARLFQLSSPSYRRLALLALVVSFVLAAPARADEPADAADRDAIAGRSGAAGFEPEWIEHLRKTASLRERLSQHGRIPAPISRERIAGAFATPPNLLVNSKAGDPFASAQEEPSIASAGAFSVCAFNTDKMPMGGDGITASAQIAPGAMWTPAPLPPVAGPSSKWIADPVVTVNSKTTPVFFFSGLFTPTGSTAFDGIAVTHGTFGFGPMGFALTWSPPVVVRMGTPGSALIDKPWLVADSSSASLYLTYVSFGTGTDSILFQKSVDGGMSWTVPFVIATAMPALLQGPRVAVGPAGEVYVAWFRAAGPPDSLLIRKSTDYGASFGPRALIAAPYSNFGSGGPGSNLDYAPDFPSLAVDRSFGTHRGRVYAAWAEAENYSDDPIGFADAKNEDHPSGSFIHATPFTPGMVLRGFQPAGDVDTWSFSADAGKTYSFLVDSMTAGYGADLTITPPDTVAVLAFSTVPTAIGSGKPNLTLFTAPCPGMYFVKLMHFTSGGAAYRMKTGVTGPPLMDPTKSLDQRDVRVAWSDDGTTWGTAARVNMDPPTADQVMPEVGVTMEGYAYAMWLDYHETAPPMCEPVSNIATARSTDGGLTWSTASGFVTSATTTWWSTASDAVPNQGDYLGLHAGDQVSFVYADGRLGDPDIFQSNLMLFPGISCVPDSNWNTSTDHTLTYTVVNPNALFANSYSWSLSGGRTWPGLPASGTVTVPPGSSTSVSVSFTVPDSAISGVMAMAFTISPSNGAFSTTCPSTDTISSVAASVGLVTGPRLTLSRAWPNPSRGALSVALSLPNGAPASLELIDLAGRRVMERPVGGLGAGPHTVSLAREAASLPIGIYELRLTQNRASRSTKVAILR